MKACVAGKRSPKEMASMCPSRLITCITSQGWPAHFLYALYIAVLNWTEFVV